MNEQNLRLVEAWFRLLAEAARGTRTAQNTIQKLAEQGLSAREFARRIAGFLPAGMSPPSEEAVTRWMESLWATTGVVPRSRYLELLERYEALRARLEEAEVTIGKLRRLLDEKGHEKDAQKLLDVWSTAVGETLRTQADWMRRLVRPPQESPAAPSPPVERPRERDIPPRRAPRRRHRKNDKDAPP